MNVVRELRTWIVGHPWQLSTGLLAVALVAVVALDREAPAAVGDPAASTTTTNTPPSTPGSAESASTTTIAALPGGEQVDPFTGETSDSGPLLVVKVDNAPEARPQIGLVEADLIVEVPVEGGLTRFTAIYLEDVPELVGPVRSLRPVDADLLGPFPGVVLATGGQRHVVGSVAATGSVVLGPDEPGVFQSLERPQPHHLFVTMSAIEGDVPLPPTSPWQYGTWGGGEATSSVSIPYGSETIEWRFEGEEWVRYVDGEPTESLTGPDGPESSLSRDTLILLFAHWKSAGYADSAGAEVLDFDVVGGGDVWILHDGQLAKGTWSRPSQGDPWTLVAADGTPFLVPTGSLYLAVVPTGLTVTTSS